MASVRLSLEDTRLVESVRRPPAVHAAMLAGQVDYPKALLLSKATFGLTDEQARAVVARVLPDAPRKRPASCGPGSTSWSSRPTRRPLSGATRRV